VTTLQQPITPEQRRQLEELYRQQVSAVRTLARLLGYPCPIASRQERRNQAIDERGTGGILEATALFPATDGTEC
jgi:hypothetical protein